MPEDRIIAKPEKPDQFIVLYNTLRRIYLAPVRWFDLAVHNFRNNRNKIQQLLGRTEPKLVLRALVVATVIGWLWVGLQASPATQNAFSDFIREQFSSLSRH